MIYNAPHFYVSNPLYQTPKISSPNKGDFTFVDLTAIEDNYIQRTKYVPNVTDYVDQPMFKGFFIHQDNEGKAIYDNWLDYYKVGFRKMVNLSGERSWICLLFVHP